MMLAERALASRLSTETYAQARERLLRCLLDAGWSISSPSLKCPHATAQGRRMRVWFKAEAVYGGDPTTGMGNARASGYIAQ